MASSQSHYRDLDDAGLLQALAETKEELFNLRFQNATGQLDNNARIRLVRRNVARINTELRAHEIAASEALASTQRENA